MNPRAKQVVWLGARIGVLPMAVWLTRLFRVTFSRARTNRYWSELPGDSDGLLYVALGDSAAQGIGASRPEKGYVGLLAEHLRAATGRPVTVMNLSRSGARIRDVLATQLPALSAVGRRVDLVTVGIGGNDMASYSVQRFTAEIEALTSSLPPSAVIADVPYFGGGARERYAQEAGKILTRSALEHDLIVVPLYEALRRRGWRGMFSDFAADWFHPSDRGYRIWADVFWQSIRGDRALCEAVQISRSERE